MATSKLRKKMHQYTISNGKMVGNFEELYKDFKDPFLQSEKEKFETSKKAILNYCQLLQHDKKKHKQSADNLRHVYAYMPTYIYIYIYI